MANKNSSNKRLDRLLSNLGYCSRASVPGLIRREIVTHREGERLRFDDKLAPENVLFDGEALDPELLYILLHKPTGVVCSHSESEGESVYALFPERYTQRNPPLVTVGRLDQDTSGALLLTDDGQFVHVVTSPRSQIAKVYEAVLATEIRGDEAELFASGNFLLSDEKEPLLPVQMEQLTPKKVRLTLHEGRYHQVRRMWQEVGNEVLELHRTSIGPLSLTGLEVGEWRFLREDEIAQLMPGNV